MLHASYLRHLGGRKTHRKNTLLRAMQYVLVELVHAAMRVLVGVLTQRSLADITKLQNTWSS